MSSAEEDKRYVDEWDEKKRAEERRNEDTKKGGFVWIFELCLLVMIKKKLRCENANFSKKDSIRGRKREQ